MCYSFHPLGERVFERAVAQKTAPQHARQCLGTPVTMPWRHRGALRAGVWLSAHLRRQYITGARLVGTLMRHYFLLPPSGPVATLARSVVAPSLSSVLVALTATALRCATPLLATSWREVPLAMVADRTHHNFGVTPGTVQTAPTRQFLSSHSTLQRVPRMRRERALLWHWT